MTTLHAAREAHVSGQRAAGTALILVRHAVVEAAFRASKVRLRAQPALALRQNAAFRAGTGGGGAGQPAPPPLGGAAGLLLS